MQYTAGGFFRRVDYGFQSVKYFMANMTKKDLREHKLEEELGGAERWRMGLNLSSTLSSLQMRPNFDKSKHLNRITSFFAYINHK
jgi:hypothetical protein